MDEFFVQGVVGGVLNRHKDRTLDKDRIQTLMVEIAAVLDRATQFQNVKELSEEQLRNYNFIMSEMSEGEKEHLRNWTRGKAIDNPLSIEMWKGYAGKSEADEKDYVDYVSSVDGTKERLSKEYLEYWTCDLCGKNTHEVDYDYLGNGTNHLQCELIKEEAEHNNKKEAK